MYDKDSFNALDKLMDFAKTDEIQKQMTQSMNETIKNMRIPGVDNLMEKQETKSDDKSTKESAHED
jgi:hypothetical protein